MQMSAFVGGSSGGGGTPGGTSGQVQWNNAGAFAGFGAWDGTTLSGIAASLSALAVAGTATLAAINASGAYTQTGTGANTFSGASSFTAAGTALAVTNNATVGGTLGVTGAVTGGTYNSQTISSAASFTGTVGVATSLTSPAIYGGSGVGSTLTLNGTSNGSPSSANVAILSNAGGRLLIGNPTDDTTTRVQINGNAKITQIGINGATPGASIGGQACQLNVTGYSGLGGLRINGADTNATILSSATIGIYSNGTIVLTAATNRILNLDNTFPSTSDGTIYSSVDAAVNNLQVYLGKPTKRFAGLFVGQNGVKIGDGTNGVTVTASGTSPNESLVLTPAGTGAINLAGSPKFAGTNSTGAGSALLGANSPAATLTAPYTWATVLAGDGSTCYIPLWK